MPKLQLCVTVEQEIQRFAWQGQVIARPVPRQARNDADALYRILTGLPHEKERFRERRRTISALCKLLRPIRHKAQGMEATTEDEVVGEIDIGEEALRFVGKLFSEPPEGLTFADVAVDTAVMIEDAVDALKKDPPAETPEKPEA